MSSSEDGDGSKQSDWSLLCKIQRGYVTLELQCPFKLSWLVSLLSLVIAALGIKAWLP